MEIGIIGLPKSGKTTVFNALTRGKAETSSYSAGAGKPNLGVAKFYDPRLEVLAKIFRPPRIVPAEVQYVDIPGAPEGLGKTKGIAGEFLNLLQRVDALLLVARAFGEASVPHIEGSIDPFRDIATMNMELAFADLGILERRVQRIEATMKGAKGHERDILLAEQKLVQRLKAGLEKEIPIREQEATPEEARLLENYQFLTAKPLIVALNAGEEQTAEAARLEDDLKRRADRPRVGTAVLFGKLEMELGQLNEAEEKEFRASLGIGTIGRDQVLSLSQDLLGLITFLTAGPNEVRAWTLPRDTPAVKAAGKIHSDLERGFIRAEVIALSDLQRAGAMNEAKKLGLLRLEGKNYIIKDGDVVTFLFNV